MRKYFVIFSASEAERTIGFRQPGDPTVQTEVAHQSNLNISAGNQVRINIGNSPRTYVKEHFQDKLELYAN